MNVKSVFDPCFRRYGQVLTGYDYTELFQALGHCAAPMQGIVYEPSVKTLEACSIFEELCSRCFGGMPIQLGFCSGTNNTLNSLEYHKSSECNIAKDDIVLLLGLRTEIENGIYDTARIEAFHIPAGVGVELFATTLHYAPCGYQPQHPFQVVCVLPRGTNLKKPKMHNLQDPEAKLCLGCNKWLLAHRDSPDARKGACVGLSGVNLVYTPD